MNPSVRFKCTNCNAWHEGVPGWGYPFPMTYFEVPESERAERCFLSEDLCVVDDEHFYVCGCLEMPVAGHSDVMVVRVWAEIDMEDFLKYQDLLDVGERESYGPYAGRLSAPIPTYQETEGLELEVKIRNHATRPLLVISQGTHPLGVEQREGMPLQRLQAIYAYFENQKNAG